MSRRVFVAYNRRSGQPWAASFDENKIYDFATDNDLAAIDVKWLEEEEQ